MANIDLWYVPVGVGAILVAARLLLGLLMSQQRARVAQWWRANYQYLRTIGLVVLAAVMLVLLVVALRELGTSTTANLAAIASAGMEVAILWLTYRSYRDAKATDGADAAQRIGRKVHTNATPEVVDKATSTPEHRPE